MENEFNFDALPITISLHGQVNDEEWPHFLWNVVIKHKNGYKALPYKTGLGLVEKTKRKLQPWESKSMLPVKPIKPTNKDIMYSLLMDSSAADQSFMDWCSDYGYSDDSIHAFKIYQACCEIGAFIRKAFTAEQRTAMQNALQDY